MLIVVGAAPAIGGTRDRKIAHNNTCQWDDIKPFIYGHESGNLLVLLVTLLLRLSVIVIIWLAITKWDKLDEDYGRKKEWKVTKKTDDHEAIMEIVKKKFY